MNLSTFRRSGLCCLTLAISSLLSLSSVSHGMVASPHLVEVEQPDGSKLELQIRGDEFSHWFEDKAGFSIVRNAAAQYVYANRDSDGRLGPTALVAGEANPGAAGLARGLQPTPQAAQADRVNGPQRIEGGGAEGSSAEPPPVGVAPQGAVKNLVILCKFADHVFGTHTRPKEDYEVLFNQVGGHPSIAPTGSVRDYFTETSYGTMTLESTVVAWVTLPNTESYYADGKDGTSGTYPKNAQGMVEDALDLADDLIDFGDFDEDNDGFVDCLSIIHSGYGAETGGGNGDWIWSHRWSLWALPGGKWSSDDTNGNGSAVQVYDYHTEPALWGTSGTGITRIGVICHETGHFFGLPDLYDSDSSSRGIGSWCLMANSWGFDGTQLRPPHPSAWCKEQLGWITPTIITSGTQSAARVETTPSAFKITQGFPSGEYLLVENRQPYGFENNLPQGGLAIWHVDGNKSNNTDEGYPGQSGWPTNGRHLKIALLQADGNYDLERKNNSGDAGDLYHSGGVSAITPSTVPNTDSYQGGTIISTGHSITDISSSGNTMTFNLNVTSDTPVITSAASATASPGTFFNYQIAATNTPTSYNAIGLPAGLGIDTSTGEISGTPTTAGNSSITLSATNAFGTGTSTLSLTIIQTFTLGESADAEALSWTSSGDSQWSGQSDITQDGIDAAESGDIGDGQTTSVETTVTGTGVLTFWWKVSSESGYDHLRFYLDGVQVSAAAAISGDVDWTQKTVNIGSSGSHTLRWTYSKDGSVSSGDDTAWIDQVIFTTGSPAPEITSVTAASGLLGEAFSYQITASNNPTSYTATGLPDGLSVSPSTGLISGTPTEAGTFSIALGATNPGGTASATLTLTVTAGSLTLDDALDSPELDWNVGGNAAWTPQAAITHDGVDSAKSGVITDSQTSWVETAIDEGGTLTFWWKVSSEPNYDFLRFYLDGNQLTTVPAISGIKDWASHTVIIPEGNHIVRWAYTKDSSVSSDDDAAWLDQVAFTPSETSTRSQTFTSSGPITIFDSGPASDHPSTVTVSGVSGNIASLTILLNGLSHTFPDDLDVFLVSPDGDAICLMSDAGSNTDLADADLTFSDSAASPIPDGTAISSGSWRPANYGEEAEPRAPGSLGSVTTLAEIAAGTINGDWNLYIDDDTGQDAGSLSSWSIVIESDTTENNPLEAWRLLHFDTSENTGDAADDFDFDHDGRSNLLEFATNSDPTVATPAPEMASLSGASIEFDYVRSIEAMDYGIQYVVEWSSDLSSESWSTSEVVDSLINEGSTTQIRKAVMPAGTGRRFVRLRIY